MTISRIDRCRVCGNRELFTIGDLGTMAFSGIFPKNDEKPVPEGPLELVKCHGAPDKVCGLVQLRHSFDPRVLFGESYGYRSGLNQSMRQHLGEIAAQTRQFLTLETGDVVLDIGSNDGTLLSFFSGKGFSLIGVDPTAGKFKQYYSEDVLAVPGLFSAEEVLKVLGPRKAKLVTAIAVFYDADKPADFLRDIHRILSEDGILVLEQSYLPSVLQNLAYDTICHEHVVYYRLKQLKWLAERTGFRILDCDLSQVNGGSLRVVLAKESSRFSEEKERIDEFLDAEERMGLDSLAPFETFWRSVLRHRDELCQEIKSLRTRKKILGYGASTKGNVILQFCGFTARDIPFIADINQDKWGRFCPGSQIPIISEEEARKQNPDVFFVLPWHFKSCFLERERKFLQAGGAFLFPLPKIDLVYEDSQELCENPCFTAPETAFGGSEEGIWAKRRVSASDGL